jgi:hypothetical protein
MRSVVRDPHRKGESDMSDHAFDFSQWATVTPPMGWTFAVGEFTGDGLIDVVGYHPGNGTLWVGRNTGGAFVFSQWATVSPAAGWQFIAGDFTGDGLTDVMGYHPSNGTLWIGTNTGSEFVFTQWGTVSPEADWSFVAGHFTGGVRSDVVGYHPSNGSVWVGRNTGSAFEFDRWGTVSPIAGWIFAAGDFTGTARTDVLGYHPSDGSLWVGENTGSQFLFGTWATVSPVDDWIFAPGKIYGLGKADVVGYHPSNGSIWVGRNIGNAFAFDQWATVTPHQGWSFLPGIFTADPQTDIVGYHSGDGELWVGKFRYLAVEGYCWPLSASPGEDIAFHISGNGSGKAIFSRHDSQAAGVRSIPVGSRDFETTIRPVPAESWRTGCDWPVTFTHRVPDTWRSGIYSARCTDADGHECHITFVVKPAPNRRSQLAILANVNTWLAYNGWGGHSKYSGRSHVSFLRPAPSASPVGGGANELHLTRGELWILSWLTCEGYRPDVYTDIDFHNGLDFAQYKCLVLSTHPEYWTTRMYDNLRAFLDGGGSLLYLGGNGLYEAGEYDSGQTAMIFRAGVDFGPRADALFRRLTPPRPERALLGVATERCGVAGSPYEVKQADHVLFAWTGLVNGQFFGDAGLNTGHGNGKASAWEVDTSNGPGATGISVDCGTENTMVPSSNLPSGLMVLARAPDDAAGRGAELVFYRHTGGGFVLSAGSLTFGGSLVVDPAIQQIVRNALAEAGIA